MREHDNISDVPLSIILNHWILVFLTSPTSFCPFSQIWLQYAELLPRLISVLKIRILPRRQPPLRGRKPRFVIHIYLDDQVV